MSFDAKNLSYESNEPAFLRKLRAQHGGGDSARHGRPQARPRKQMKDGEEDDQPTYVVEDSQNTLSKEEYEALMKGDDAEKQNESDLPKSRSSAKPDDANVEPSAGKDASPESSVPVKQQAAAIGASSKRRLAKVVGDEDEEVAQLVKGNSAQQKAKPKGRRGKRVKLSFDDNEGNQT